MVPAHMRVAELFAGIGTFSDGAIQAGAEVVFASESNPMLSKLLVANVPYAKTSTRTYGPGGSNDYLPDTAPDLHLHVTCPSKSQAGKKSDTVLQKAMDNLRWSIDFIFARGDASWSVELLPSVEIKAELDVYKARFPAEIDWTRADATEFGAPQSRVRIIAGPPKLIERLREMPVSRLVGVRDAFFKAGLTVPAPSFKNQTRRRDGTAHCRTVEQPAFTVCASHGLTWCHKNGKTVRTMSTEESAVLMGISSDWVLPRGSRDGQRAVASGMCPGVAKAIVQISTSIYTGNPIPSSTLTFQPAPGVTVGETLSLVHSCSVSRPRSLCQPRMVNPYQRPRPSYAAASDTEEEEEDGVEDEEGEEYGVEDEEEEEDGIEDEEEVEEDEEGEEMEGVRHVEDESYKRPKKREHEAVKREACEDADKSKAGEKATVSVEKSDHVENNVKNESHKRQKKGEVDAVKKEAGEGANKSKGPLIVSDEMSGKVVIDVSSDDSPPNDCSVSNMLDVCESMVMKGADKTAIARATALLKAVAGQGRP